MPLLPLGREEMESRLIRFGGHLRASWEEGRAAAEGIFEECSGMAGVEAAAWRELVLLMRSHSILITHPGRIPLGTNIYIYVSKKGQ